MRVRRARKRKVFHRRRTQKLLIQFIAVALVAMAAMGLSLAVCSGAFVRDAFSDAAEETVRTAAVQLADRLENLDDGAFLLNAQGQLYKGERSVNEIRLLEELHRRTGVEYSIFFSRDRVLTTLMGQPARDIAPEEEIYARVVTAGQDYFTPESAGKGSDYYSCYVPLRDPDGTIVGMAAASVGTADMGRTWIQGPLVLSVISVCFIAVTAVLLIVAAQRASTQMGGVASMLSDLSEGALRNTVDNQAVSRRDEIGEIAEGAKQLDEKLTRVIHTTREVSRHLHDSGYDLADSAWLAADASGQMADRMNEVVRGAAYQAESVRSAVSDTDGIAQGLGEMAADVSALTGYAGEIRACLTRTQTAVQELVDHADEATAAAHGIDDTIRLTNEAVNSIAVFSKAVTGLASQTNLLALNASIEASRAGEHGKGFAVLAEQIRQLAEESRKSAEQIQTIAESLSTGAQAGIVCLEQLNASVEIRGERLHDAGSDLKLMSESVRLLEQSMARIADHMGFLDEARLSLSGVMQDLATVTEQNAASTEETTASMQELHNTFTVISASAEQLQGLADDLRETMSFFRI